MKKQVPYVVRNSENLYYGIRKYNTTGQEHEFVVYHNMNT